MAHVKADRVQETTTGTGTGALTLLGAVSKFRAFSAVLANADTCVCLIEHNSAAQWEVSLCTYASGGNTLTRSTVYASSSGGSLVNLSAGTKTITLLPTAAKMLVEDNVGDVGVTRRLGVGTTAPAADVHVLGSDKRIRVQGNNDADASYSELRDISAIQATLNKVAASGNAILDMSAVPSDGTSQALVRLFRNTLTTGARQFIVCEGDGTATAAHLLTCGGGSGFLNGTGGFLGVGATTPLSTLHMFGTGAATTSVSTSSNTGATLYLQDAGNAANNGGVLQFGAAQGAFAAIKGLIVSGGDNTTGSLSFQTRGVSTDATLTERMRILNTGHVQAGGDNTQTLGTASFRWSTVYAGTGTINTSDANDKSNRRGLTDAEVRVGRRLAALVRTWQFNDAIAAKGEAAARWHSGWVAQGVVSAFEAEELDPFRYACVGFDELDRLETYTEVVRQPKMEAYEDVEQVIEVENGSPVLRNRPVTKQRAVGSMAIVKNEAGETVMVATDARDEAGQPVWVPMTSFVAEFEEVEETRTRIVPDLDGNGERRRRLNVRPDQLAAFVIAALDARLTALEPA